MFVVRERGERMLQRNQEMDAIMHACLILCIYNIHGSVTCLCVFLSVTACVLRGLTTA